MHLFIRVLFSLWNHHTKLYCAVYIILNEMLTESELAESRNDLILNYTFQLSTNLLLSSRASLGHFGL